VWSRWGERLMEILNQAENQLQISKVIS